MKREIIFALMMSATLGVSEQEMKEAYLAYSQDAAQAYARK